LALTSADARAATRPGRVGRYVAWHPEWPVAAVAAAAWLALVAIEARAPAAAHHHHPGGGAGAGAAGPLADLGHWTLMTVAMMVPAALPAIGYVALNSLVPRRGRAMALATAAYVAVWLPFGAAALALRHAAVDGAGARPAALVAATAVVAVAWQATRAKRRAVLACGTTVPLPPRGARADLACLRFGLRHGERCLRSCWALMLVMAAATGPGALGLMAVGTAVTLADPWFCTRKRSP
jgi:predicted metal-binding membrane protein